MTRDAIYRRMDLLAVDAVLVDVAMAGHAPPPGQRFVLTDALHRFDGTMARLAPHRRGDMRAMIEVHEVRQLVHPLPRDRLGSFSRDRRERLVERQRVVQLSQLR